MSHQTAKVCGSFCNAWAVAAGMSRKRETVSRFPAGALASRLLHGVHLRLNVQVDLSTPWAAIPRGHFISHHSTGCTKRLYRVRSRIYESSEPIAE